MNKDGDDAPLPVRAYHRLLVWDIMRKPLATRLTERMLNPVLGKSFVFYATKGRLPAADHPGRTATTTAGPSDPGTSAA